MRVFTEKQLTSLAAILLTVITFAVCPPDAFCRTHSGNRTRSSRTVRLDDHDHDYSPDLRSDDHQGDHKGQLLFTAEATVTHQVVLASFGTIEIAAAEHPAHGIAQAARGRAPPAA